MKKNSELTSREFKKKFGCTKAEYVLGEFSKEELDFIRTVDLSLLTKDLGLTTD